MDLAGVGVGIPDGTKRPFQHGGLQQRKKRFGFSKSEPIPFAKSQTKSRKGWKN